MYLVPEAAIQLGFSNGPGGTHDSRTIMLSELRLLLEAVPSHAPYEAYAQAVLEENVLGKRTLANRKGSLRRLRELYGLSPSLPVFRALRLLWDSNVDAQPMLAFLCAAARDPLLRAAASAVLETPVGELVTWQLITERSSRELPGRFSAGMLAKIGRNAASSWQQSGHLQGKLKKIRVRPASSLESTVYALALGYLTGARGEALFGTFWIELLDAPDHLVREQAREAARCGWLDYKSLGGVSEIEFPHLLPDSETQTE